MGVTHTPKAGSTLTGAEYEGASSHIVALSDSDIPATIARDTEVTQAVADHSAAADPHTGYRLESADHTHATTGLQGGTVSHAVLTSVTATDHHAAPAAGPDANITVDSAGAAGTASTFARSGHGHQLVTSSSSPAAVGTAAAGTSGTAPSRGDHVHATGAGTPSTQAFGDSATTGSGPAASMTDHKHAMPTLGFGLTGNSAPAVSLTNQFVKATATTSISAATYADVTGLALSSLAAGTWLVMAMVVGSSVNAQAIMHVAITDNSNVVQIEGSQGIVASGTASVAQLGTVHLSCIVSGGQVFKVRAARGLTTITGTWTAMDGAGTNTTNNLTDNSDKGSFILAVRIA